MPQLDISTYPPQLVGCRSPSWPCTLLFGKWLCHVSWMFASHGSGGSRTTSVKPKRFEQRPKPYWLRWKNRTQTRRRKPKAFTAKQLTAIGEARTKLQEETAARLAEETQAAEQRIADEQAAARETIPEVAGDVTRAAVERLTGASVADTDVQVLLTLPGAEEPDHVAGSDLLGRSCIHHRLCNRGFQAYQRCLNRRS